MMGTPNFFPEDGDGLSPIDENFTKYTLEENDYHRRYLSLKEIVFLAGYWTNMYCKGRESIANCYVTHFSIKENVYQLTLRVTVVCSLRTHPRCPRSGG